MVVESSSHHSDCLWYVKQNSLTAMGEIFMASVNDEVFLRRQLGWCPGFSQDGVNFHQEPGGNTAGQADPTWPNRAGYSIPCAIMPGSGWGGAGQQELTCSLQRCRAARMALSVPAVCVVYSPYLYRCCYCSLCLLFCQTALIPTHRFFACFFPFSSATQQREGRPLGPFVASRS